jgi:hypothetical protein
VLFKRQLKDKFRAKFWQMLNPKQGVLRKRMPFLLRCPFSGRDRQQLVAKFGNPIFHVLNLVTEYGKTYWFLQTNQYWLCP